MNEKKLENIKKTVEDAERKKKSLLENNSQLEEKIARIKEKQNSNLEKIKKIDFFLEKTKKILQE